MKTKLLFKLLIFSTILTFNNCGTSDETSSDYNDGVSTPCGYYNGHKTYTGPKGGCYYINSNGNKTYVDKKYCC